MTRLVLVGMSAREVDARDRLTAVAGRHDGTVAFLQMGDPSLHRELSRLTELGAEHITLIGVSLGTLAPATSWLRRIASHWWREHPGEPPAVEVATAMMRNDLDLDLVRDVTRPITGTEAPLSSAAWEDVPGHRHQVFVCRGPRCTALGSDRTAETFARELMRLGQSDDDVLITQTGCQFPCNHAPVVSVQPDDVWYGGVTPDVARTLTTDHLVNHRPVEAHRLSRRTQPDDTRTINSQEKSHD